MPRQTVNTLCARLPGAEVSDPWGGGHDCWKVGGKMFAVIGSSGAGVSVKTASIDEAAHLIDLGLAERAAYLHRSWVMLPLDAEPALLEARIAASHALICKGLPKRVRTALGV